MRTEIWYSVQNGGDGSAYPHLMESKELCEIDQRWMVEGWAEQCIGCFTIESEGPVKIVDGVITVEDVIEEIEEDLAADYMKKYKESGQFPEWFKRLEGKLANCKKLMKESKKC